MQQQISFYPNTFSKDFQIIAAGQMMTAILNGDYSNEIAYLRTLDAAGYKEKKKLLPCVTWSGTFKPGTRLIESIETYSHLVVLDVDNLDATKIELLKQQLSTDPFVFFCFVSPSGNGIKILVSVNTGPEHHLSAFLHLQKEFEDKYFIKIDPSGKDICRLCYVSSDDRAIWKESTVFQVDTRYGEVKEFTPNASLSSYRPTEDLDNIFKVCTKWVSNTKTYVEGERNVYIHAMACAMNRCGVAMEDAINLITLNLPTPDAKWHQSVKSAYFHNQHEFGAVTVRDISSGTNTFVAPPYIANYTDDVVANDIMRITATLFYQKVSVGDIQDIVGKITRYYNKEGLIDLNRASLDDLMNRAIYVLNQNMAAHSAQTALKYETAEEMGNKLVNIDLVNGLIPTYIPQIDEAMYGGMMPGNVYGLIGLGGTYKSVVAQNIAYQNALNDIPTLYLNGEMSEFQFYERLALMAMNIDLRSEMYHKRINKENIGSFIEQLKSLLGGNIFVFTGSNYNYDNIISTIQHIKATTCKDIKLIVADGLSQFDSKGKEEIPATIYNSGVCKEISKATNTVIIPLIHLSGDAAAYTLRDTGMKVRGGIKTLANLDGYFSTSLLVDPETSSLENTEEVVYRTGKMYLRLKDKRTRAGVVPTIVNIKDNLHLEQEECDPRSYELNASKRN